MFTEGKVSHAVMFLPTNALEIAFLLGVSPNDLPVGHADLTAMPPACGNQIRHRIDPMLWTLHNPWVKLDLRISWVYPREA